MFRVSVIMGSKSDMALAEKTIQTLNAFGVENDCTVLSAHRAHDRLVQYIDESTENGVGVYICIAGLAAHLPGVVASLTHVPVIGVPVDAGPLNGFDALLSIVQMPKGVPVASVGIGSHGAVNAALLAVRILSATDPELKEKLLKYIEKMAEQ
jgi:phosphoribosylaminoimidazole carboxylase PurE protein